MRRRKQKSNKWRQKQKKRERKLKLKKRYDDRKAAWQKRMEEYREYITSDAWRELRDECLAQAHYVCDHCAGVANTAHHIRYDEDFSFDCLENLVALCWDCHRELHPDRKADK